MNRLAPAVFLGLFLGLCASNAATAAVLRNRVVVEGEVVKLGDLFDGVGDNADVTVTRAPAPGHRITVDADWLAGVAARNDIDWRPRDSFEEAVIERTGQVIGHEQIEAVVLPSLTNQGMSPDSQIEWDNRNVQLVVPIGALPQLTVRDLIYDTKNQRFSATVEYNGTPSDTTRLRVSGRLFPTVEMPVLARNVGKGEIIMAHDIEWARVRQTMVRREALVDVDQIIGMTPRQNLRGNQMLTASELQRPIAVARGATVTMILQYGAMTLSTQGRAVDQGSVGDVIHLVNPHSNMTVEGVIDGPNHVTVALTGSVALAN